MMRNKRKYSDFLSNQAAPPPPPPPDPAMAQLPEDLVIEILLCLPVKSLLRFKCLSTYLSSLINSPDFINSHHRASCSQSFNRRKIIFLGSGATNAHVCDMNFDLEGEEIIRLENNVSLPSKDVYGYCKGLLLVVEKPFYRSGFEPPGYCHQAIGFGLWNPSIRKYQDLTRCDFGIPAGDLLRKSYSVIASGLGYDDSSGGCKAYKAVFKVLFKRQIQVWIYELKSGIWRRAENFTFNKCSVPDEHPGVSGIGHFTDGSLHWLYTIDSKPEIVAFDMREETFSICSQPVWSIASMNGVQAALHVLEGCLCISYFFGATYSEPSNQAALYVRKKAGEDQFIWTQLYSVTDSVLLPGSFLFMQMVKVLGYTKRGDKILLDILSESIISYDLNKKFFAEVTTYREAACFGLMLPCLCIENLATVVGGP